MSKIVYRRANDNIVGGQGHLANEKLLSKLVFSKFNPLHYDHDAAVQL
jgi:hypothetical protein